MFRCLVLHVHDIISGIPMKQFIPCRFIEYPVPQATYVLCIVVDEIIKVIVYRSK